MRAGLDGDVDARRARAAREHRQRVGALTGARRAPAPPVRAGGVDHQRDRRAPRPRAGREARKPAYARPSRRGARVDHVGVLGVHDQQRAERGPSRPSRRRARPASRCGNSVDAGVEQEALEAEHPGVVQRREVGDVARDRAAPEADVDAHLARARPPAWSRAPRRVVVGGMQLSGMSTIVVTPPAAAARVAVAKPSHSVRPGSLTCTWVSTRPGSSTSSSARRTTAAPPRPRRPDRPRRRHRRGSGRPPALDAPDDRPPGPDAAVVGTGQLPR